MTILITVACFSAGYGFYRMNDGDWINAVGFTMGILGILLSYLRAQSVSNKPVDRP